MQNLNFLNLNIWYIAFFSFIPLVPASVASYVDNSYSSDQDLYDALLNTFFPISFVILFDLSGESGPIKNVLLPLLDDVLYNAITWMIPLIVSFSYDDLLGIKIFSIINMCLHVFCAVYAIFRWETIDYIYKHNYSIIIRLFLIFFPVLVIPIFWIVIITTRHAFDSINMIFLILFGILLFFIILFIPFFLCYYIDRVQNKKWEHVVTLTFIAIFFYAPNILQTLLIVLNWPINFYFVKACVFILVLSLTRNVSYWTDKVPDQFLATSTVIVQYLLKDIFKDIEEKTDDETEIEKGDKMKKSVDEKDEKIDEMKKSMDEMKKSIDEKDEKIDEMKKSMDEKIDEMKRTIDEMKKQSIKG